MPSYFKNVIVGMKKFPTIFFILWIFLSPNAFGQEEFPFSGRILSSDVNVRAGQSKNFEELGQLQQDETVIVVGKNFSWYKILLPPNAQSYIFAKFVEPLGDGIGMITASQLNIRARPDVQSSVLGRVNKGMLVRLLEPSEDWYRIEPVDQSFGWVFEDYIAFHSRQVPPPRVVTPPVRNVYKRKRMEQEQQARAPTPEPQIGTTPPTTPEPEFVTATGVIAGLGNQGVTENVRHQLVVDGKPAYYLKGYRKIMDGFLNYKVNIEGEILPDIQAPYPVVLVTKIRLIL